MPLRRLPRIREIIDPSGRRMRIAIERHLTGLCVRLTRCDQADAEEIALDLYSADVLCGFVMAARLAAQGPLPDEVAGGWPRTIITLRHRPEQAIELMQPEKRTPPLVIPATFWDRLYAELSIVSAHGRALGGDYAMEDRSWTTDYYRT